jgi:hypothetical protein
MPERRDILKLMALSAATIATAGHPRLALAASGGPTAISAMTIAPDGRLIVADWRQGALLVLAPHPARPAPRAPSTSRG